MKIPKMIVADGQKWNVRIASDEMGSNILGTTFPMIKEILLNEVNPEMPVVLLHELIHVVDFNRGLGLTEEQVTSLSSGIYALIVDNKLDFRKQKKKRTITIGEGK